MNEVDLVVGAVETLFGVALGQIVGEKRSQRAERFLRRIVRTDGEVAALTHGRPRAKSSKPSLLRLSHRLLPPTPSIALQRWPRSFDADWKATTPQSRRAPSGTGCSRS